MKAELKEIAGYYPYGLMFEHTDIEDDVTIITEWISVTSGTYGCDYTHSADWGEGFDPIITPILRPMSDLTKKIRHRGYNNGEPFVPLVELAKIDDPAEEFHVFDGYDKSWACYTKCKTSKFSYFPLSTGFERTVNGEVLTCEQYPLFDLLNQWFFDYRGLIPQGRAKSVHDLKSNPYE